MRSSPDIFDINTDEYTYDLPPHLIASYPCESRDSSRLLISSGDDIKDDIFSSIHNYLPSSSVLVLNKTRVIQARLRFQKESGAKIEIFCLEPLEPYSEIYSAFSVGSPVVWRCMVGNARRWKSGKISIKLPDGGVLKADLLDDEGETRRLRFDWEPACLSFGEVLGYAGKTPLPPYIARMEEESDKTRYQTVFAENDGSVAAPTAGLHFSEEVFKNIEKKNIKIAELSLHVGAGTFKPLTSKKVEDHYMHQEQISIAVETIKMLAIHQKEIIAVGTTCVRSLESLYHFGQKLEKSPDAAFDISQWEAYNNDLQLPVDVAMNNVLEYCKRMQINELRGRTRLMIIPGYRFAMTRILITNFHQPASTLLLLVGAFAGKNWRKAYDYALRKEFRMLSYGDSCLFIP